MDLAAPQRRHGGTQEIKSPAAAGLQARKMALKTHERITQFVIF